MSLPQFGALLGAMTFGATLSLLPWGLLIDRSGERWPLSVGIATCGIALWLGTLGGAAGLAAGLLVVGAFGAVANVASGSAVAGWFGPKERGLALGIRQAAVPLGGAIAAVALPPLVAATSTEQGSSPSRPCASWSRWPARRAFATPRPVPRRGPRLRTGTGGCGG